MSADLSHLWHNLVGHGRLWTEPIKWVLYFGAGWGAIYYRRWRKSRDENAAQGWPSVNGTVYGGKVMPIPHTKRFMATLEYRYFVEEYRLGKYIHEFPNKADAEEFVSQMKDKHVPIRYNPSNANKSVLEQSVIEQHVLIAPRFG
jgi:hypothetical protein